MTTTSVRRTAPLRVALALSAVAAGLAHVPVTAEHLRGATYMGVAFVAFTVVCGAIALATVAGSRTVAPLAAVAWCGGAIAAYAATRLVAFPQLADDVGNWTETWGVVSVAFEALTVALGLMILRRRPQLQHA